MTHHNDCRHYSVELNDLDHVCALGLDVLKVTGGPLLGIALRIPCKTKVHERDGKPVPRASCARFEPFTAAELEEQRREREELQLRVQKVIEAVTSPAVWGPRPNSIPCPACGDGTLHLAWSESARIGGGLQAASCSSCPVRFVT